MLSPWKRLLVLGSALWVWSVPVYAQEYSGTDTDGDAAGQDSGLLDVSLEDLLVLESTSVAKKRQNVRDSAAAVYVISQEEIRNSPAGTVADLLRTVPGVEVGQIANGATAVSIRGFNGRNSNSLLVMIDGRSLYVSTLSGVFWDQLNLPLQDIERIEVVRGPGATLWGANAVNGVINIITKNSADSLGARVIGRVGNRKQEAALSYGTRLGEGLTLRAHGSLRRDEGLVTVDGEDTGTATESGEVGIRLDWEPTLQDAITLQADYATGSSLNTIISIDPLLFSPVPIESATPMSYHQSNVLMRWRRQHSEKLDWSAQVYFSNIKRKELGLFDLDWSIADIDLGANWRPNETHDINFGINARALWDSITAVNPNATFMDPQNTDLWVSAYIQDDISLIKDKLRLTIGAKLERNNFTGFEFQPGVRLFYRPVESVGLWGAVTRAVRTPSRFERSGDLRFTVNQPFTRLNPGPLPLFPRILGSEDLESENVTSFEAGIRADIAPKWNIDIAGYYNRYADLNEPTFTASNLIFPPGLPFPTGVDATIQYQSRGKAETWGIEAVVEGEVTPWWQTQLSYSYFGNKNAVDPLTGVEFVSFLSLEGSPDHQAALTNNFQISSAVSLHTQLRYVDSLLGGLTSSYISGDARLRYEAANGLEISLIGENLFEDRRLEFLQDSYPAPTSFNPRSVALELRYRF